MSFSIFFTSAAIDLTRLIHTLICDDHTYYYIHTYYCEGIF